MFDVLTPLKKIHRPVKRLSSTFSGPPGTWGYLSNGLLYNIASTSTNQPLPQVLKPLYADASTEEYEGNDIEVGSAAVLEGLFRAVVNGDGFQLTMGGDEAATAVTYTEGMELTVAHRITTATATTSLEFSKPEDIGKLKPKYLKNELVVAAVERFNSSYNELTFQNVSPHLTGTDLIDALVGIGALINGIASVSGEGENVIHGQNTLTAAASIIAGVGIHIPLHKGAGSYTSGAATGAGQGVHTANLSGSGAPDASGSTMAGAGSSTTNLAGAGAVTAGSAGVSN